MGPLVFEIFRLNMVSYHLLTKENKVQVCEPYLSWLHKFVT